jgi:hypothetical protein
LCVEWCINHDFVVLINEIYSCSTINVPNTPKSTSAFVFVTSNLYFSVYFYDELDESSVDSISNSATLNLLSFSAVFSISFLI